MRKVVPRATCSGTRTVVSSIRAAPRYGRSITRTRTVSPGAASPFSSQALSMMNDFLPGTLSTRRVMRSTLVGSKVLTKRRVKTLCIVAAIGRERIARSESVFDLNRCMTLQPNLSEEMERGAFTVQRILRETAEGDQGDKERRELRVIDEFEMERLLLGRLAARDQQGQIQGNHRGRRAQFSGDRGEMVARDSADGAADVDDFRGSEIGRKRCDDAAARHRNLNVT